MHFIGIYYCISNATPPNDFDRVWFQQWSSIAFRIKGTRVTDGTFPNRWIRRRGTIVVSKIPWFDITWFFLWGFLKERVYKTRFVSVWKNWSRE